MKTYPLKSISIEKATEFQFKFVDCITQEFNGSEILTRGDLGVKAPFNMPETTQKVENVIARFFDQEAALFVRGAGTAAIFQALYSQFKAGQTILLHSAEIYETTKVSLDQLNIHIIQCDFNDLNSIKQVLESHIEIVGALIQYSRQSIHDSYDMEEVIKTIKSVRDIPIITDDNYVALKVDKIGVQLGATLSCFSSFKLLGPQGVGVVVGDKKAIDFLRTTHYSGGSQVQGFEALDVLFGLVYAPVALAVQATQIELIVNKINSGQVEGVKQAVIANAQSKVVLVELENGIAKKVLEQAVGLGAASHPIGAESKFEMVPMFYRLSKTMRDEDPIYESHWVRINPMRAGSETVLRILSESIKRAQTCS